MPLVKNVGLEVLETRSDFQLLERWVRSPHVVRWWGNPDLPLATLRERPTGSHALITADGRPVGYLCWQRLTREEVEAAGLTDLPEDLVDIDILIGEVENLGCGVAPNALALLLARLRGVGVGFAGMAASMSNHAAIRAYEKVGFRGFREFRDPEAGRASEHFAMHNKGLELPGYDVRGLKACALGFMTST